MNPTSSLLSGVHQEARSGVDKVYRCDLCAKGFTDLNYLEHHWTHHLEMVKLLLKFNRDFDQTKSLLAINLTIQASPSLLAAKSVILRAINFLITAPPTMANADLVAAMMAYEEPAHVKTVLEKNETLEDMFSPVRLGWIRDTTLFLDNRHARVPPLSIGALVEKVRRGHGSVSFALWHAKQRINNEVQSKNALVVVASEMGEMLRFYGTLALNKRGRLRMLARYVHRVVQMEKERASTENKGDHASAAPAPHRRFPSDMLKVLFKGVKSKIDEYSGSESVERRTELLFYRSNMAAIEPALQFIVGLSPHVETIAKGDMQNIVLWRLSRMYVELQEKTSRLSKPAPRQETLRRESTPPELARKRHRAGTPPKEIPEIQKAPVALLKQTEEDFASPPRVVREFLPGDAANTPAMKLRSRSVTSSATASATVPRPKPSGGAANRPSRRIRINSKSSAESTSDSDSEAEVADEDLPTSPSSSDDEGAVCASLPLRALRPFCVSPPQLRESSRDVVYY